MSVAVKSRKGYGGMRAWATINVTFDILAAAGMAAAMWAAFLLAKPALNLSGNEQVAQRIFYLHIGTVMGAVVGFTVAVIGSVLYLITRNLDWDRVTRSSVELGTIFGIGILITGSIWAKPTWNTYWTWDPRLTAATITVLIYVAYLLFRNGIDNRQSRAMFSSIYALFAFLSVPLTYYSARWFRTIHPVVFDGANMEAQGDIGNVGATMGQTLGITSTAFILLFAALMIHRWRQLRLEDQLEELREELD
jgi:heme exporter protein C